MRLLNSSTYEIKEFVSDEGTPPYAMVSHTWDDEEVSFQDWQTLCPGVVSRRKGYQKISYACAQAIKDGIAWLWIDTYAPLLPQNPAEVLTDTRQMLHR